MESMIFIFRCTIESSVHDLLIQLVLHYRICMFSWEDFSQAEQSHQPNCVGAFSWLCQNAREGNARIIAEIAAGVDKLVFIYHFICVEDKAPHKSALSFYFCLEIMFFGSTTFAIHIEDSLIAGLDGIPDTCLNYFYRRLFDRFFVPFHPSALLKFLFSRGLRCAKELKQQNAKVADSFIHSFQRCY